MERPLGEAAFEALSEADAAEMARSGQPAPPERPVDGQTAGGTGDERGGSETKPPAEADGAAF